MFESIMNFFKKMSKKEEQTLKSKDAAKERLHLVLMQDRANVSADFLDLMKQEIIEVIKKYIDIDESAMDVRLTNKENGDGSNGAPALYANIPILNIKDEVRQTAQVKASEKEEPKKKKNEQEEKESREEENKVEERNNTKEEAKEEAKEETKKVEKQTQKTKDKKIYKKEWLNECKKFKKNRMVDTNMCNYIVWNWINSIIFSIIWFGFRGI